MKTEETKQYTIKEVRETLKNNPTIGFIEMGNEDVKLEMRGSNNLACCAGAVIFHIWPVESNNDPEYLNKFFADILPGVVTIDTDDSQYCKYQCFKKTEEGSFFFPHGVYIYEKVGVRYDYSKIVFTKFILHEKFENSKKDLMQIRDIVLTARIQMYPSESEARKRISN